MSKATPKPNAPKTATPKVAVPFASVPTQSDCVLSTPSIRVLKNGTCPSISARSMLTYQVGCTSESEIQIRVSENSGGGCFSQEWVALKAVQDILVKIPEGKPINTRALQEVFTGRSINSSGFLLAVLTQLGLMQAVKDQKGCYELRDAGEFFAEINSRIATENVAKAGSGRKKASSVARPETQGPCPASITLAGVLPHEGMLLAWQMSSQ